jgi:membrane-bound lytic murein transglycosylase D
MKKHILFLLFIIFSTTAFAQVQPDSVVVDSLEVAIAEEEMLYKEDTADYVFYSLPPQLEYIPGDDDPAVIRERLSCIQKTIPLRYNDKIHAFINYFTVKDREYTRMMMRRKNLYFPLFEKYLAKYGLPDELKYLSIIESGLNPRAISRARAVGLWQFMSATGRYYGVPNTWFIDDRMDPEKSTDAACRYLRDLYNMFHDWELALAAYNTGPGNIKRAIRRSGYKRSFWEIYPKVHRETRAYVPQFVAIVYTMNHLDQHNFLDEGSEMALPSDTVHVTKFLHFETFANLSGICLEDLQKLNPSVTRNAVPDNARKFVLHIPSYARERFDANRFAILDSSSKVGKKELEVLAKNSEGSIYGRDRIVYKVRSGDVLGSIAIRHGVKVADLKKWNNLRSNMIRSGQRLNIWLRPSGRTTAVASAKPKSTSTTPAPVPASKTYVVQEGDTLWDIAKKFEGLTVEKIKTLNNMTN